jgi:hypothetical protein
MAGGEEQSIRVLWLHPVVSNLCVVVRCRIRGTKIFVWANSRQTLLQGLSLNVQIWVNGLIVWHNVYQSRPLRITKKWPWLPPLKVKPSTITSEKMDDANPPNAICLRFKAMDPCLIPTDDPWHKVFTISLVTGEQIWTTPLPAQFCDSRLGFVEPKKRTLLRGNSKRNIQN